MVTMQAVESSSIRAIGYDEARAELWVEFHSSADPYVYFDVPPEVYGELEEAESKGEYVNLMVKPYYEFERRRRGATASRRFRRRRG